MRIRWRGLELPTRVIRDTQISTDNYGKFLSGPELDFVIGHELGHVKAQHGRKKLLIVGTVFAGIALACFFLPPILIPFRPLLDIPVMYRRFLLSIFSLVVLNTPPMRPVLH